MMDLHDAAANALRTAWLNGKANTTEGWALHVEADNLLNFIREQIARDIITEGRRLDPRDAERSGEKYAYERSARIARGQS